MEQTVVPSFDDSKSSHRKRRKRCFETEEVNEDVAGLKSIGIDVSLKVLKLVFPTVDEAESFYIAYGREIGFDIRTQKIERVKPTKFVKSIKWVCNRQGCRGNRIDELFRVRESRPETRHGCGAFLRVSYHRPSGLYKVTSFEPNHNHELATGDAARYLRCNRYLTSADKNILTRMKDVGIRPAKTMKFVEHMMGGIGNLPYMSKDGHNFLTHEKQNLIRDGDVNAAFNMMDGMKLHDQGFVVKHSLHEDGSLANLLIYDSASKADYDAFGDVLIIDSTYKTNKYERAFAVLSGVNNNGGNCIFGAALLCDEKVSSYRWLLRTFVEEMNYKFPPAMLSDQDASICRAISEEFPLTKHRLCSWHLCQNATQKVRKKDFVVRFGKLAKRNCSVQEFEEQWAKLVRDCGVGDNPWVIDMYEKKMMWSEAFFRGVFLAGMSTTQRAESINALLKMYFTPGLSITEFVKTYHQVVLQMRNKFIDMQLDDEIRKPKARESSTFIELEEYAANACTKRVYKKILKNIFAEQSVITESKFKVGENSFIFTFRERKKDPNRLCSAAIDMVNENFQCDCMMLESRGVPCPHLLAGLKHMDFETFPTKCIHRRWLVETGKSLRMLYALSLPKPNFNRTQCGLLFKEVINICLSSPEEDDPEFTNLLNHMRNFSKGREKNMNTLNLARGNNTGPSAKSKYNIRDPAKVKSKGATKGKKQTCTKCKVTGHNRVTCTNKPSNNVQTDDGEMSESDDYDA